MKIEFDHPNERLAGTARDFPRRLADFDARHVALETFATYLSLLTFARTGDPEMEPIAYRIMREHIHTEQPGETVNHAYPTIVMLAGEGVHDRYGLGPPTILDETADVYAPGKALVELASYSELLNVEIWASNPAQRRGLVAGMLEAMMPLEESSALRLKLPEYFDRVATFEFDGERYIDDPDIVRGRFRAQLRIQLTVPEVALVKYGRQRVLVDVETVDGQVEAEQELAAELAEWAAPQS